MNKDEKRYHIAVRAKTFQMLKWIKQTLGVRNMDIVIETLIYGRVPGAEENPEVVSDWKPLGAVFQGEGRFSKEFADKVINDFYKEKKKND